MSIFDDWNNLKDGNFVSFTAAQGNGITPQISIPNKSAIMTKADISHHFGSNCNLDNLNCIKDNEWVWKGLLKAPAVRATGWRGINPFCVQKSVIFYNTLFTTSGYKNDCSTGIGSYVVRQINAGLYSSTVSQDDANQVAYNAIANTNQSYFNDHGTCIILSNNSGKVNTLYYNYTTFDFLNAPYNYNPDISGQYFEILVNNSVVFAHYESCKGSITIHHGDRVEIRVRSMFSSSSSFIRNHFNGVGAYLDYEDDKKNSSMNMFKWLLDYFSVPVLISDNFWKEFTTLKYRVSGYGVIASVSFVHDFNDGNVYINGSSEGQMVI